jgi:hypothetical protein
MLAVGLLVSAGAFGTVQPAFARDFQEDPCVQIGLPIAPGAPNTCTVNGQPGISNDPKTGGAIVNYARGWLRMLNGAVGLFIMLMLVISGIQYITSAGEPSAVKAAKGRLMNTVIGLVAFLSMYAILGFILPGGL